MLGPAASLILDVFSGWDFSYALNWCKEVESLQPRWLEEPFSSEKLDAYTRLTASTSVPIATGEHFYGRREVHRFLNADAIRIVQADQEWCGGVSEPKRICALASSYDLPVILHGHNLHAALHVVTSENPSTCPLSEFLVLKMASYYHFNQFPLQPENGRIALAQRPGFGMAIDRSMVGKRENYSKSTLKKPCRLADTYRMVRLGVSEASSPISRQQRCLRPRLSCRRGNALVEFSLCALPLFALFLGVADVSLAVFLRSMLQSSVRDGVRFGITYSTSVAGNSCGSMTDCIKVVVQRNSLGFLNGANGNLIEVNYYQPTDLETPITAADCDPNGTKTMRNDTQNPPRQLRWVNQPGNLIEVRVRDFPWNWMVPLPNFMPGGQIKMTASATDVLQGLPAGSLTPPTP